MNILFFGRYNQGYSRNRVLMRGLQIAGHTIIECRVEPSALFWPLRLMWRYFLQFVIRHSPYDILFVAFPGQEVMLIARLLTRRPILFDAFTSHYEGYVEDRRVVVVGSLRARWYGFLDYLSCRLASVVLTDTHAHAQYFHEHFGVPMEKLHPVLLGTTLNQRARESDTAGSFVVHFHGSNIPLQGIDTIWGAIRLLGDSSVRFQMIGPFGVPQDLRSNVTHINRVPFDGLASYIARADVCLGIFGTTAKTQRVIPNKVYEAIAVGRPVITADTPAIRELLDDNSALLIPTGDSGALAEAILRVQGDHELRTLLMANALRRLSEHATPAILGQEVSDILVSLL